MKFIFTCMAVLQQIPVWTEVHRSEDAVLHSWMSSSVSTGLS